MKRVISLIIGVCIMGLTSAIIAAPALHIGKYNPANNTLQIFPPDNTYKHLKGHHVYIGRDKYGRSHFVLYNIKKAKCRQDGRSRYVRLTLDRVVKGDQPPKALGSVYMQDRYKALTLRVPLYKVKKWGTIVKLCPTYNHK